MEGVAQTVGDEPVMHCGFEGVEVVTLLLESSRGCGVQQRPVRRREALLECRPHDRMHEPERSGVRPVDEETGACGRVQVGQGFQGAGAQHVRQDDHLEVAPDHGGGCQRVAGAVAQTVDALEHPLTDARREVLIVEAAAGRIAEVAEQLEPEEGAPTGERVEPVDRVGAEVESARVGHRCDVGGGQGVRRSPVPSRAAT